MILDFIKKFIYIISIGCILFVTCVYTSFVFSADVNIDAQAITPPVITSPEDGIKTASSTITVSGSGGSEVAIRVYVNDIFSAQTKTSSKGDWAVDVNLSKGVNLVYATTLINGIESSKSNSINITYIPPPNSPLITYPENGAVFSDPDVEVKGTAGKQQKIFVYIDEKESAICETREEESWEGRITLDVEGENILTAAAMDIFGNISSSSDPVKVFYYPEGKEGPAGEIAPKSIPQKIWEFIKKHWPFFAGGGGAIGLLLLFIIKRKKKEKGG